jgi:lipopolysaccharide transport system ATP-binding protein
VHDIIAFSELEQFIDTPIKRYSSGMRMRLGYAVATAVDTEILIVDEVLAVGDLNFQRKSMARMQRLIQDGGTTVLIVGHNVRQLERICSRMILMDHGRIAMDGPSKDVSNRYFDLSSEVELEKIKEKKQDDWAIDSSKELVVNSIYMTDADGNVADEFVVGQSFNIVIELVSTVDVPAVDIGIAIQTSDLLCVGVAKHSSALELPIDLVKGFNRFVCRLSDMNLLPGLFALRVAIRDSHWQIMWHGENLVSFRIKAPPHVHASRYSEITFIEFNTAWCHSIQ